MAVIRRAKIGRASAPHAISCMLDGYPIMRQVDIVISYVVYTSILLLDLALEEFSWSLFSMSEVRKRVSCFKPCSCDFHDCRGKSGP